ncbi:MAG: glycosyltransferase family 9 protein [Chromatiaceae bacterium]|nr:glycosyltransferase family 9 protein [Chromatiaceae bacterium]MCP5446654.1 glycosyltransferase family 9 protein [Chromatiaceae bacterium]
MHKVLSEKRSILLIRLSAIGDIVMATPVIKALRQQYPGARICWLVQSECAALLEHNPSLNETISWPRKRWKELWQGGQWRLLWREIAQFRRMLRDRNFDLAIDMQGLLKSGVMAWLSGAGERIGLGSREGSGLLMSRVVSRGGDPARIGSEYLHLMRQLGFNPGRFEMQVALADADLQFVRDFTVANGLHAGYAVVCPFTTRDQKHWLNHRWVELIPRLQREIGVPVVILGGPGDRSVSEQIAGLAGAAAIDLTGRTGLTQAAAIISEARLLVGVDTGLTHMGIAFSRPTVALFGSTCPYLDTTRDHAVVLYHKLPCSPCRRNPTCNGRFDCMAAITVDEVMNTALEVTQKTGQAAP